METDPDGRECARVARGHEVSAASPIPLAGRGQPGPLSGWWGHLWRQKREEGDRLQLAHLWNRLLPSPAPARSRNLRACPPQAQAGSHCSPLGQESHSCLSSALGFRPGILPGVEPGEGGGLQGLAILPLLVKLMVPCFPLTSSSARRREQRSRGRPLHTRTLTPDPCVRASLPFFACTCKLGRGWGGGAGMDSEGLASLLA